MAAAFAQVDRSLIEASSTLGASGCGRSSRIILPLSLDGVLAGAVLSFAHTLGEFGVVLMVGGNLPGVTRTVSISIYDNVQALDYAVGQSDGGSPARRSRSPCSHSCLRRAAPAAGRRMMSQLSADDSEAAVAGFHARSSTARYRPASRSCSAHPARERRRCFAASPGWSARTPAGSPLVNASLFDTANGINLPARERRAGFVFQQLALFPHLSVADNIGYGLDRLAAAARLERVRAIARVVSHRSPARSQARRPSPAASASATALARSLVTDPGHPAARRTALGARLRHAVAHHGRPPGVERRTSDSDSLRHALAPRGVRARRAGHRAS